MYLLQKSISSLNKEDIEHLINFGVQESKTLDFKKELNLDDRKEFLADISAMANTEGGTIVYGIEEQKNAQGQNTGIAGRICPITLGTDSEDKMILRIEEILGSGLEPRINNIAIKFMQVDQGEYVLVLGVTKNLGLPHMVTYKHSNKFYKRRNSGKYALDVYELNDAFMRNYELEQKVEAFRKERTQKVMSKAFTPDIMTTGAFFLHVIPLGLSSSSIDLSTQETINFLATNLRLLSGSGHSHKHNVEGFLNFHNEYQEGKYLLEAYAQFFRQGAIEFYTTRLQYEDPNRYPVSWKAIVDG